MAGTSEVPRRLEEAMSANFDYESNIVEQEISCPVCRKKELLAPSNGLVEDGDLYYCKSCDGSDFVLMKVTLAVNETPEVTEYGVTVFYAKTYIPVSVTLEDVAKENPEEANYLRNLIRRRKARFN